MLFQTQNQEIQVQQNMSFYGVFTVQVYTYYD